ncbi:unnamed protein product, partial [Scytosiphon promiscuus]
DRDAARSELHNLLVKKLIARYGHNETGHGIHSHPANHLIQAEVDLFMHNHSKVKAGDLSRLERAVRSATRVEGARRRQHSEQEHSPRRKTTPRLVTPRCTTGSTCRTTMPPAGSTNRRSPGVAKPVQRNKEINGSKLETSSNRLRPSTAGSITSLSREQQQKDRRKQLARSNRSDSDFGGASHDDARLGIPNNIKNEWLILETYQQLVTDEKHAEKERMVQAAIQRCKRDLDKQIQQNLARSNEEKQQAEARKVHQQKMLAKHEADQKELKESARRKTLEEKCVRASQILDNTRRRENDARQKDIDDARLLADCKQKLAEEKQAQLEKRKQIAKSLREMNRENVAKLAVREQQRLREAEEDKRLMKEYEERLDRQANCGAERAAAHNKRLQRYEMIGNQWARSGAGKTQHDKDVAEERRVLAEAAMKEEADADREIRDKEALRVDRLRCLEDNKRLIDEKNARKKEEAILEATYAEQFRSEGEEHMAKDLNKRKETAREKRAYARKLEEQVR